MPSSPFHVTASMASIDCVETVDESMGMKYSVAPGLDALKKTKVVDSKEDKEGQRCDLASKGAMFGIHNKMDNNLLLLTPNPHTLKNF